MNKTLKFIMTAVAGVAIGGVIGVGAARKMSSNAVAKVQQMSDKHLELFKLMNQWVRVKQEGKNLSSYFEEKEYKRIAIYGMSFAGEALVDELRGTNTHVLYGIDKRAEKLYAEVDIVSSEEDLEEVDAIVVTAITFFEEIEEKLSQKIDCPIVSLEDILYEL